MKQKHTKYTQINTNKSTHSEMGPVWQNPIQRTVKTAHLSVLTTVHSFSTGTQYNTEQFWYSSLLKLSWLRRIFGDYCSRGQIYTKILIKFLKVTDTDKPLDH